MSRFPILLRGLLAGALLCAAPPGRAHGDEAVDSRLARKLVNAAGKSFEYQEATARYGVMAEFAQTMLQKRQQRADLIVEIRNMDAMIATFPQNRLRWMVEQWDVYNRKLDCDRLVTVLDRQLEELNFRQQRIYEEELENARKSKRSVRPIRREAILDELNRLDRECEVAVTEFKDGIRAAAKDERISPRTVLQRVCGRVENLYPRPDVPPEFLREFIKHANSGRWLDAVEKPGGGKATKEKKTNPGKANKGPSRPRKNRLRSDDRSS